MERRLQYCNPGSTSTDRALYRSLWVSLSSVKCVDSPSEHCMKAAWREQYPRRPVEGRVCVRYNHSFCLSVSGFGLLHACSCSPPVCLLCTCLPACLHIGLAGCHRAALSCIAVAESISGGPRVEKVEHFGHFVQFVIHSQGPKRNLGR